MFTLDMIHPDEGIHKWELTAVAPMRQIFEFYNKINLIIMVLFFDLYNKFKNKLKATNNKIV